MNKQIWILGVLWVALWCSLLASAQAQNIPNSAQPGAILQWEQRYFNMQRTAPYLFGVVSDEDLAPLPKSTEPVILYAPGVIPGERKVQGVLVTPENHTYISPDGP